jgi:hypothetical protein
MLDSAASKGSPMASQRIWKIRKVLFSAGLYAETTRAIDSSEGGQARVATNHIPKKQYAY